MAKWRNLYIRYHEISKNLHESYHSGGGCTADSIQPQELPPGGASTPEGEKDQHAPHLYIAAPTRPPGGVTRHICRWVDVLSSRDATTGRSGLGLLRDDVIRAPYRWLPDGLGDEYQWSQQRDGSSQARTTNSLRQPDRTSGTLHPGKVIRHSIRRAALPFGESGPVLRFGAPEDSEADGSWRTMRSDGT